MSDLLSVIKSRRSTRAMETRSISDADLAQVLEAIRWAPSWANTQCWEVVVVQDPEVKKKLQESLGGPGAKGNPASRALLEAPVTLVMCAKTGASGFYKGQVTTKFGDWLMFDLGLATQNLCLMAHELGLATVIIGLFDHDKAAAAIQMDAGYELVVMVPMGYPAKTSSAPKRRELSEIVHYDQWKTAS